LAAAIPTTIAAGIVRYERHRRTQRSHALTDEALR
jgi:hypothetical protein